MFLALLSITSTLVKGSILDLSRVCLQEIEPVAEVGLGSQLATEVSRCEMWHLLPPGPHPLAHHPCTYRKCEFFVFVCDCFSVASPQTTPQQQDGTWGALHKTKTTP